MIRRVVIKECLSFTQAQMEFGQGLHVFSGPSGAGKSVLMEALLSFFGRSEARGSYGELEFEGDMAWDEVGIEAQNPNLIRYLRKEKVRFFANDQAISKKGLLSLSKGSVKHLSLKESSELSSDALITTLDQIIIKEEPAFFDLLARYTQCYHQHQEAVKALADVIAKESTSESLREFAQFECDKIMAINPQIGEDDELFEIKKSFSRLEKLQSLVAKAQQSAEGLDKALPLFELMDQNPSAIHEAVDAIGHVIEQAYRQIERLESIDPETLLDRLEQLAGLKKRYGSLEGALDYLRQKQAELALYEDLEGHKKILAKQCDKLQIELQNLADQLHARRLLALPRINTTLCAYLGMMYLGDGELVLTQGTKGTMGADVAALALTATPIEKISSGEFNRLRLAWMATRAALEGMTASSVLFLDEIDANLSGEESHSVGRLLKELGRYHQIFAISHQPQLTSLADTHFLVTKEEGESFVRWLDSNGRIDEVARINSGDQITQEARNYAKKLCQGFQQ